MILVLGGTAEARELAAALVRRGVRVVSSLAGRVANPRLPEGEVRVGGFGGSDGLATWLVDNGATAVIDATHPFAKWISAAAVAGAAAAGVPLLRLQRPGWQPEPGDDWHWAASVSDAAALLPALGERVFLTTGRQGLTAFAHLDALWFLVRCVDPPAPPLPASVTVILGRGPYTVDGELELMHSHRIDVLVTKDSGGDLTRAKLTAARTLGIPVVIVRRPPAPDTAAVPTVDAALSWVKEFS
jgi:precorrin-6A/cobalt-precorrin-6A reductase